MTRQERNKPFWLKFLMIFILLAFIGETNVNAQFLSKSNIEQELENPASEANLPQNELEYLVSKLRKLSQLEHYRIDYMLMNNRNNKRMTHIIWYGDAEENVEATFNFYNSNFYPDHYQLNLLGYNNFELAYTDQFAFLDSMAFFDKPHFSFDFDKHINPYLDYYLEIDTINRNNLSEPLLEQLLLLPDLERLLQISPAKVHRIKDNYFISLERLEIPDLLMRRNDLLRQVITSSISMNPSTVDPDVFEVNLTNSIDLNVHNRGLDFELNYQSILADELLPNYYNAEEYNAINRVNSELYVKTSDIIDKITNVRIAYNDTTGRFHITLLGITENFQLNLFTSNTANFKSYEFQIDFSIQPTDKEIVKLDDIQRMSEKEFNYILTELINAK